MTLLITLLAIAICALTACFALYQRVSHYKEQLTLANSIISSQNADIIRHNENAKQFSELTERQRYANIEAEKPEVLARRDALNDDWLPDTTDTASRNTTVTAPRKTDPSDPLAR